MSVLHLFFFADDSTHPQLNSSPSFGSPSVNGTTPSYANVSLLNRTTSDESGMSSRFFMLKKDSERRNTLARFMLEYKNEVFFSIIHLYDVFLSTVLMLIH